ncbi:hypothetical protein HY68_36705 [Streptomyces sp. AcH 505]|uniref:hypothetical protein n=1 Tax=Streptomyces sp. AcH 505 TaxID=352211 RepID=UPI0005922233|nr:hypothetical protein HY68_36705 [Streptomyces sp. AcH 505]
MATAVLPHAQTRPCEIQLHRLAPGTAAKASALLDQADHEADNRNLTASALLHGQVIDLIGIRPPASGELARCSCQNCYGCTRVFDAVKARTYRDGTVEFVQCETCADEHRIESD